MIPSTPQTAIALPQLLRIGCRWTFVTLLLGLIIAPAFAQDSSPSSGSSLGPSGYESGGYGSEPGSNAEQAANLTTGPTPMSMFQLIQPDWKPLQQEFVRVMTPSTAPAAPPTVGPQLRNEANVAFRYGNLPLASELYYGFLAQGTQDATEDLQSLKFSHYFRRPVWQLRWAVSLGLHGDTDVTDFAPIRAETDAIGGRGTAMESAMDMSTPSGLDPYDSRPDDSSGAPGTSGTPGSSRGAGMSSSDAPSPGPPSPGMETPAPSGSYDAMQGGPMGVDRGRGAVGPPRYDSSGRLIAPNPSAAAAPEPQMTDPAIAERFDELMGYVGTAVTEGMQTRIAGGQFGAAFANVDPDATDQGNTVDGDYVQASDARMWIPRIVFLGEGSSQEMSKAAAEQSVELLLHFDVNLKNVRNSTPQNSTRVKVIDGRSGRTLVTSAAMDNRELQRLLQTKRETAESYVNGALEKFWSILDSRLSVQTFPELTPEVSRRRVTGVLAEPTFSLLRKLAEIQYMGHQGWLTADEVEEAYAIAAGNEGMTILYGSPSEATDLIHEIAKRAAANKPGTGS